jgi:hypothetical protein
MMIGTPLIGLRTEYIPGPDNIVADFLSRKNSLLTPRFISLWSKSFQLSALAGASAQVPNCFH